MRGAFDLCVDGWKRHHPRTRCPHSSLGHRCQKESMVGALNRSVLTSHSIAYPAILEHRAVLGASSISWTFLLEEMAPAKLDTFCTSGTQIVGALLTQGRANHLAMKMSQCATIAGHRGHQQDSWPLRGPHLCPWAQWRSLAILQTWTTVVQLPIPKEKTPSWSPWKTQRGNGEREGQGLRMAIKLGQGIPGGLATLVTIRIYRADGGSNVSQPSIKKVPAPFSKASPSTSFSRVVSVGCSPDDPAGGGADCP